MSTKFAKTICVLLVALLLLTATACTEGTAQADDRAALQSENEALRARVSQLETELSGVQAERDTLQAQLEQSASERTQAQEAQAAAAAELEALTQGYKRYKNVISQEEVRSTLFGQPISPERNGEYRIGIETAIDGDYHATLTIYQAREGSYVEVFSCEALVGKNGPGKQSEGDVKTPLGTWTIGEAYGIREDPGSLLPYTQVTDDMYWCATGSNGTKYNTLLYKSDDPDNDYSEDEHLMDYPIRYAYFLDLGYNAARAPYAGNAIFLHCWKEPDYPTGGCVAVSEESMVTILRTVTPGTSVTIY